MKFSFATKSIRGIRPRNEDAFLELPEFGIFGVFDGCGGHQNGAEAAQQAADVIRSYYTSPSRQGSLAEAMQRAHYAISQQGDGRATTGVVVDLFAKQIAWAGDSRAVGIVSERTLLESSVEYSAPGGDNWSHFCHFTVDHSVPGAVFRGTRNWHDYLAASQLEHRITHCLGILGYDNWQPELQYLDVSPGDRLLLFTDGLLSLPYTDIKQYLQEPIRASAVAYRLVAEALAAGSRDNITAQVIDVLDEGLDDANQFVGLPTELAAESNYA